MESLDSRLSALLKANLDLLLTDDADWQLYLDTCVRRRRRINRLGFSAERRLRACPSACARLAWRAALLLTLLAVALAGLHWRLGGTDTLEEAALAASFALRRLSVPLGLHRVRYLQDMALSEIPCLVPNPLARWLPEPRSSGNVTNERCCLCSIKIRQSVLRNATAAKDNYRALAGSQRPAPFLITNALEASGGISEVTYSELRKLYMENREQLEGTGYNWVTRLSGPGPADMPGGLADVFADSSGPPAGSVVSWRSMHVEAARLLRRLHPRPAFIGREMEIGLIREVVFIGSGAAQDEDAELRLHGEMRNVHATLLQGRALLSLAPLPECGCPAGQRAVLMRAGQLLFFRNGCHELRVAPAPGEAAPAILYIGSQL